MYRTDYLNAPFGAYMHYVGAGVKHERGADFPYAAVAVSLAAVCPVLPPRRVLLMTLKSEYRLEQWKTGQLVTADAEGHNLKFEYGPWSGPTSGYLASARTELKPSLFDKVYKAASDHHQRHHKKSQIGRANALQAQQVVNPRALLKAGDDSDSSSEDDGMFYSMLTWTSLTPQ
jgi:hypothetical protein